MCLIISSGFFLNGISQKKNYLSLETGYPFSNANQNIEQGMRTSGFDDSEVSSFLGLFGWTVTYPSNQNERAHFRMRAGHYIKNKTALEAGFGLVHAGTVKGYDEGSGSGNYLNMTSRIHNFYAAIVVSDSTRRIGFGIGPSFSFYKLTTSINGQPAIPKNYFLPGVMITTSLNLVSRKLWYLGFRTDLSFTAAAKIDEITIQGTNGNPKSSTFKSTRTGSFTGAIGLQVGIRFSNK